MSLEQAMQGKISGLNFSDTSSSDRRPEAAFIRDQFLRSRGTAQKAKPLIETVEGDSGNNQTTA